MAWISESTVCITACVIGITLEAENLYELIANTPGDEVPVKKADDHRAEINSGAVTDRIVGMLVEAQGRHASMYAICPARFRPGEERARGR